jgi:AcrR family transcriptional regulator
MANENMNENIKERIVRHASEMFAQHGCKLSTMDEIAGSMGMSKRTLYEHFADKDALVAACIMYFYEQGDLEVERIVSGNEDILTALLAYTHTLSRVMMQLRYNFFVEVKKYFPQVFANTVVKFRQRQVDNTRRMVQRGKQDGLFMQHINEELVAELISGVCRSIFTGSFDTRIDEKHLLVGNLVFYYMRGIATSKGMELLDRQAPAYKKIWYEKREMFHSSL